VTAASEFVVIGTPDEERAQLTKLAQLIESATQGWCSLRLTAIVQDPVGEETSVELPDSASHIVTQAVALLVQGASVSIAPVQTELTTQEAADYLNVSRQYLVRLLDRGDIPHHKVGTHRRVMFGDLLQYRQRRDAERVAAIDRLDRMSQEMGVYG
jgi:excisionase family DNA binding protein